MSEFFFRQLAKAARQEQLTPGQQVRVKVDLALAHDGSGPAILRQLSGREQNISGGCRVVMTLDHCFPASTVEARVFQHDITAFARQHNIRLFRNGEGVLHQVIAEEESLWPGMVIVGADGHVATAGAFGGIAFSVSASEFVEAITSGSHLLTIPDRCVIAIEGKVPVPVLARDIAMHIIKHHHSDIAGKAVLLTGETIDALSVSEKMSICNFLPEGGVTTALILPQGEKENIDITITAAHMTPLAAAPGNPNRFARPADFASIRITAAIAGGCSSGRLDDMRVIADVLAKNEVHPDVTFIVTPASRNVMESMDKLGISSILRSAGAVIMPPGCGPCPGNHFGLLCDKDTAITTTIRNSPGRIGAREASIYLASPLTVALSAVHGVITEPQ